jgi:hypothetical protein
MHSPDAKQARNVHFPWASAAATVLDSYVGQGEDAAHGAHSYIAHWIHRQ